MAWIDYQKAYDKTPNSWISECLELFWITENTKKLLVNTMNKSKLELKSKEKSLANNEISRGIFQGDSLSPLLSVLCTVPLYLF